MESNHFVHILLTRSFLNHLALVPGVEPRTCKLLASCSNVELHENTTQFTELLYRCSCELLGTTLTPKFYISTNYRSGFIDWWPWQGLRLHLCRFISRCLFILDYKTISSIPVNLITTILFEIEW